MSPLGGLVLVGDPNLLPGRMGLRCLRPHPTLQGPQ